MPDTDSRPHLLDDLPLDDDTQLWEGLGGLAASLARLLPVLPATSPVLISGDWGSGKTTLLRSVCRRLGSEGSPAVWFDAWEYEGSGPLLPALLRRVWEATPATYRSEEKAKRTFRDLLAFAWRVAARAAPALVTGLVSGAAGPEAGVAAGLAASNTTGVVLDELGKAVGAEAGAPPSKAGAPLEPPEDPVAALWRRFDLMVRDAWGTGEPGDRQLRHPPIIFVDDLDRCSPLGAVALLDDLRVLVNRGQGAGCRFVVAMDRVVLAQAIAAKFTQIKDYDGNRYLEKVFPIVFTLPTPQGRDVNRLVNSFLAPGPAANTDQQDALSQALSEPMFANPRLMKRCINRFRLVLYFEAGPTPPREASETATRDRLLAKWIVATERWPGLRVLLPQHGEEFWREVERAATTPDGLFPSPDVRRLIEEQGALPWLRREVFAGGSVRLAQLREAEQRLRKWGL